eukprot:TRINITY_DN14112_c0_g1_i1.p1 TRINITY_DN14112_c0_g1~~TRINITY_DN14112_c0_g1_i1.p1  ORF type:complete len:315 (+),score=56.98 TRINITY_DN14112_c0_g1_i1:179-1123(+)
MNDGILGDTSTLDVEDLGERLGREFGTLKELKNFIISEMDPNRTGMIGVGEWMCVWMRGRAIERKRGNDAMRELMGGRPRNHKQCVMAAAVASYVAAMVVKKEYEMELVDDRTFAEKQHCNLWYGDAATWRTKNHHRPSVNHQLNNTSGGNGLLFTHKMLVEMRSIFQDFEDGDSVDTIRFGSVSAYLTEIRHNPILGPLLSLSAVELNQMLDDLVVMARRSLDPTAADGTSWVEPSFPFITIFSLIIKHVTTVDHRDAVVSFMKKGLILFKELSVHTPNAAPIRTLISMLATTSPQSFRDSGSSSFSVPRQAW